MKKSKKILVTAFHPGSANALVPIVKRLQTDSRFKPILIGHLFSEKVFNKAGLKYKTLLDYHFFEVNYLSINKILQHEQPDLVLTGTSIQNKTYPVLIEQVMTKVAKEKNIPTLAVLDMWGCYVEKFSDQYSNDGRFKFLPDQIAVIDERAKLDMIKDGFNPKMLYIAGNPHFQEILTIKQSFNSEKRLKILDDLNLSPAKKVILLATQPIKGDFSHKYGYDQETILDDLLKALNELSSIKKFDFSLLIKVHPRDVEFDYNWRVQNLPFPVVVNYDYDTTLAILASDIIIGAFSTVLIEARLLDKIAISLQPGLLQAGALDLLITNQLGITLPVYEYGQIGLMLQQIWNGYSQLKKLINETSAVENILFLIESMLTSYTYSSKL